MDEKTIALIVGQEEAGMRLDAYLREKTSYSRSRIVALMEEGALLVDGVPETKAARKTEAGMKLTLSIPEVKPVSIVPQDIPIDILYQDEDVVLVNKPCGMVVHPAAGNEDKTLVNALLYHVHDLSVIGHAPAQQPRRIADKRAGRCFIRPHISVCLANQDKAVAKCSNIIGKDQLFASYAAGYNERANLILRFVQADTLHQTDLPMIADDRKITQYADADQAVHLFPVSLLLSCPHP